MVPGFATPEGTAAFKARFDGKAAADYFGRHRDLWLSSIGIGTYLGEHDEATDAAYRDAVAAAVERGCNVIDSAINYRFQRSERSVGRALAALLEKGYRREELVVCTKGGFLAFDGAPPEHPARWFQETYAGPGIAAPDDIAVGSHCMTPKYLAHEIDRSRKNLGVDSIDVYYVHNPETQLGEIAEEEFVRRIRGAFEFLEGAAAGGKIRAYGTATWEGFRTDPQSVEYLPLQALAGIARSIAGEGHHFRFIQLPFSLWMAEAYGYANQLVGNEARNVLEAAADCGVTVVGSASMLQARMLGRMPGALEPRFPGCATNAQRAIQFARSAPGLAAALVGMSRIEHVTENLRLAAVPKMPRAAFEELFRKLG